MPSKSEFFLAALAQLDQKIEQYQQAIADAEEAAANETKSSAGDKYETGRAMMHLEKEKNDSMLQQVLTMKGRLQQIDVEKICSEVGPGALVRTSLGLLFFLESVGKVELDGEKCQVISMQSPIGQVLRGAKAGVHRMFNGRKIEVLELV